MGEPAHPFGWYGAADLPGLHMFEDARTLALALLSGLSGLPGPDGGEAAATRTAPARRVRRRAAGPVSAEPWPYSPAQMARTASIVSASAAGLSGRCRSTRAKRSATPPGYRGLAWTPSKATSTTSSGRTRSTP